MDAKRTLLRTMSADARESALAVLGRIEINAECIEELAAGSPGDGVAPTPVFEIRVVSGDYARAASALRAGERVL